MNAPRRPVDRAMEQDRPEKRTIRHLWIDEVRSVAEENPPGNDPWYLTLPGSEGHDIQLLIDEGLISLTEVDSIAEEDQGKIVAVERNNHAILTLQKKFIGLRIKEVDFRDLIRGENRLRWPEGDDEKYCRARVVNLDLNTPLRAFLEQNEVIFPVLVWIEKLCRIHARSPRTDWTLCLTLHGEVIWPEGVNQYMGKFLSENLGREPVFNEGCKDFFGEDLYDLATRNNGADFTGLDRTDQQKLIMIMVPKIMARFVHNEGWQVRTERNLRYGGGDRAPMVTWIVKFTWDKGATAEPDATYCEALREIFSGAGEISVDGDIIEA